jgi:SAM-dependent methyltransferase
VFPLRIAIRALPFLLAALLLAGPAAAQQKAKPYEPTPGQPGKDVVWVPTPDTLVETMLDLAKVTKDDFVIDLGSGDGRNIIAAAKRGANALGIEYNEKLVELARENAEKAGVSERAKFEQGDMFEADISKATVLMLFLLNDNLDKLAKKFLDLKPGTRIALNYFTVSGWGPDRTERIEKCDSWCSAHLYIVPAKVQGVWQLGENTLDIRQDFQRLRGTLTIAGKPHDISQARMEAEKIIFTANGAQYEGRVDGTTMTGTFGPKREAFSARLLRAN